jgi:hypothetical protein
MHAQNTVLMQFSSYMLFLIKQLHEMNDFLESLYCTGKENPSCLQKRKRFREFLTAMLFATKNYFSFVIGRNSPEAKSKVPDRGIKSTLAQG